MTAPELKPCPFCGGAAMLVEPAMGGRPYVACDGGFCTGPKPTSDAAIAKWNTRTVPDPAALVRAALEAAEAKLHWLWDADGTVTERRVSADSTEEIRALAADPAAVAEIVAKAKGAGE